MAAGSGAAPTKGDPAVVERNQSVVVDSYAVGVMAEVVEHILKTTERWFGVQRLNLFETAAGVKTRKS